MISFRQALVRYFIDKQDMSKAGTIIQKFKLNADEFPEVLDGLEKNCLQHWIDAQNWMQIEEKFWDHPKILSDYVAELIKKNEHDIALSITKRHDLLSKKFLPEQTRERILDLLGTKIGKGSQPFKHIENDLFTKDALFPTEVALDNSKLGTYLDLRDFNVDVERDVVIISSPTSKEFEEAAKKLSEAKIIGFDSEFRTRITKFGESTVCLIQLAIPERVFLFDCLALAKSPAFPKLLWELFGNPEIIIVLKF